MVKQFITAVKEKQDEGSEVKSPIPFEVDDRKMVAHHPGDGQLAMLMVSTSRHESLPEKIAGIINFFVEVLDDNDHHYMVGRLLDRKDSFGIDEVTDVLEFLVEEWTGRPTGSPSAS